jgi:hypothetical protein
MQLNLANPEKNLIILQVGYVLSYKCPDVSNRRIGNIVENKFRKSVRSIKNSGLISPVYLCGIRKTMTEPIRKPVSELQRPAPSRLCSYMTKSSSTNSPIIPNTKNVTDGTLQQTYCNYD